MAGDRSGKYRTKVTHGEGKAVRRVRIGRILAIALSISTMIMVAVAYAADLDVGDVKECDRRLKAAKDANNAFVEQKKVKKQECDKQMNDVNRVRIEMERAKQSYDVAKTKVEAVRSESRRISDLHGEAEKKCVDLKQDCDKVWPLYVQMAQSQEAQKAAQGKYDEAYQDWLASTRKHDYYSGRYSTCTREMEGLAASSPPFSRLDIRTIEAHCAWLRKAQPVPSQGPQQPAVTPPPTRPPSAQPATSWTVRLATVGPVEDKVDTPVRLKATVEGGVQAPPKAKYGYYWYVNNVFRRSGVNMDSYGFRVPRVGLRRVKVMVKVIRTSDEGKNWQPVGEAAYDFSSTGGATNYVRGKLLASANIPATQTSPTKVGVVLENGRPYIVVGKGFVSLWNGQTDGCDSVFRYKTPMEPNGGPRVVWGQLKLVNPSVHLSELIRQQTGKEPVYQSSHQYEAVMTGTGLPLEAIVFDGGGYDDNHGELTVEVYEAVAQ